MILGYYVTTDCLRLEELLERWPPELFDPSSVISAIHARLKAGDISESDEDGESSKDWRVLTSSLAKLYLANGQPRRALGCYIRLQDADAAMELISTHHLVDAVADDIPGFILLRITKEMQRSAPLSELESASLEPVHLLVEEAHHGIVPPETVIQQLEPRPTISPKRLRFANSANTSPSSSTSSPRKDASQPLSSSLLIS